MTRARDLANLIGSGNFTTETLTATAGQTAFTPSNTFTSNFLQVFYNGLLLDPNVDYTENGTTITLTVPATAGDEMEVVTYNTFSVGDAITQTEADNRYVNASGDTMTGPLEIKQSQGSAYGGWATALNLNSYYPSYDETAVRATIDSGIPDTGVLNTTYGWIGLATRGGDGLNRRLVIDSSGRVTMPYQPTVRCRIANASYGGVYAGGGVSSLHLDPGYADFARGGMAVSGDRVTVPVSGVYYCSAAQLNSMNGAEYMYIKVNGSTVHHGYKAINGLEDMHAMATLSLSANDYVQIYYESSTADRWQGPHSVFNLFLIG